MPGLAGISHLWRHNAFLCALVCVIWHTHHAPHTLQCTTDDTCLEVEVLSNQTCERLSFSVVASTGQSSSNAATVEDTVPLCKSHEM